MLEFTEFTDLACYNSLVLKLKNRKTASQCTYHFGASLPYLGSSLPAISFEFREFSHQGLHPIYR